MKGKYKFENNQHESKEEKYQVKEVGIIYDKEYGEVIIFESNKYMNDSNDIVSEAILLELLEEKYRNKVRWAFSKLDYKY